MRTVNMSVTVTSVIQWVMSRARCSAALIAAWS